jgi:geranylgeranyl reductase family protein
MSAQICDVLIVGGGPAGSTCAWQLVRAGLDVMVMDKQFFPRDKVCAGWVTPAVLESLEIDRADYARGRVLQPVRGFRTGMIGGPEVETRYDEPVSYGIRRCEFDHHLLQRSGARFWLGQPLKSMARKQNMWCVNDEIRTPLVVGAGGHFCPVSRLLGTASGHAENVIAAQEIEFSLTADHRRDTTLDDEVVQLYFCPDLKGYGWCFVKGGYLNVGLGREDGHKFPAHVETFCRWLQERGSIPPDLPDRLKGHAYLLYPASRRTLTDDGVLLVGDAAGLAYPQSGEGIRPAVESALMAADVIVAAAGDYRKQRLAPYVSRLTQRFGERKSGAPAPSMLPHQLREAAAAKLMATRWFARHVLIDRWFLHRGQPALLPQHGLGTARARGFAHVASPAEY